MKVSSVHDLMRGTISIERFKNEIHKEVESFQQSLKIKGNSSPIYLEEDIKGVEIDRAGVYFLCQLFADKRINNFEMNYLIEAMLLSDAFIFQNETIRDALEDLVDPEYGLKLTNDYIKNVLSTIK